MHESLLSGGNLLLSLLCKTCPESDAVIEINKKKKKKAPVIINNFSVLPLCARSQHNRMHWIRLRKWAEKQSWAILTRVPALLFSHLQQQNFKSNEPAIVFAASGMCSLFIAGTNFYLSFWHWQNYLRKIKTTQQTKRGDFAQQMLAQTHAHTQASGGFIVFAF